MHFKERKLRERFLSIPLDEATFMRRGFRQSNSKAVPHLEEIGRTFLHGYHTALAADDACHLALSLNKTPDEFRGFAYEGAAMALELLDRLTPWGGRRLEQLLGCGETGHIYMIHVGAGWAFARLPWLRRKTERGLGKFDHLLRWLVVDGFGFHEGYFNWRVSIRERKRPKHLSGYGMRAFDQGLGRSIWFVEGADVTAAAEAVAAFDRSRHKDLWAGVGLACTYAGGVGTEEMERLKSYAGLYLPYLAQGAIFAATARQKAGIATEHTRIACKILCGMSVEDASLLAEGALRNLPGDGGAPAYELWRQRIQAEYAREVTFA
jgi:hypothetical protein